MNKFYILIAVLSFSLAAKGQSLTTSQSYILTTTYTAADGVSKVQDVDYYDGLGGISQRISVGASPDGESILTPIFYDAARRQSQQYLPYAVSGSGTYVTQQSAISAQKVFYNTKYGGNNGYSYTESVYEASPLNRVNEAWNVGNVYRTNGKRSKFSYDTNMLNEVMRFKVNSSGNLTRSGFHFSYTLHKNSVTNEDGTKTIKYTDNLDHVVMERIINGSVNHDTYYVYDNRGNLCYVLPQKLVDLKTSTNASLSDTDTNMDALAYIYKYDDRNRCIVKKMPGTKEVYMIYDKADRLILTQDGNMKGSDKWIYTVYDNLHRPVRQNLIRPTNSQNISPDFNLRVLSGAFNSNTFLYPTASNDAWVLQFPLDPASTGLNFESYMLSETRYGGYSYLEPAITPELDFVEVPDIVSSTDLYDDQTGLKSYEKVAVLDGSELTSTPTYVERKFYYDYKGRVIQTVEKNHLGSISRYSTKYDFTGNVLANYEQHLHQGVSLEDVTVTPGYQEEVIEYAYVRLDLSSPINFSTVDPANLYFTQNSVQPRYYIGTTHGIREPAIADFFYIPLKETDPLVFLQIIANAMSLSDGVTVVNELPIELNVTPSTHIGDEPYLDIGPDQADDKLTVFTYDNRGRLLSETTTVNGSSPASMTYTYDELGKLQTRMVTGKPSTQETFTYNIQGWLTRKASTFFDMKLSYFDPRSGSSKARYGGDIAEWKWKQSGQGLNSYEFTYDALGRVLSYDHVQSAGWDSNSSTQMSKPFTEAVTYDKNGNILTMQRKGTHVTSSATATDNLGYTYTGNKLTTLNHNNASGSAKAAGSYAYTYDANGNMTKDSRENLEYGYNSLNLLGEVKQGVTTKATYRWLADGTKAGVKNHSGTNGFEYLGTMVYARNPQGGLALESTSFGGGRVVKTSGGYEIHYHVTDHLGNVRATHYDNTTSVTANDYYAFGKRHNNSSLPIARGDSGNRWQFNGKEKQLVGDVGFLDFGARMYNPEIARWTTQDPLAEKYYPISPYTYALNNPVRFIDPNGMDIWEFDDMGNVLNQIMTKELDAFYMMQNIDGEWQRSGQELVFEYGTVIGYRKELIKGQNLSIFEMRGDDKASQLFEFMANTGVTTNVEWTHAKIGTESSGRNVVGTSHSQSSTALGSYLLNQGYTLREVNHNHPGGNPMPSGQGVYDNTGERTLDLQGAGYYIGRFPSVRLNIYVPFSGYSPYSNSGTIDGRITKRSDGKYVLPDGRVASYK